MSSSASPKSSSAKVAKASSTKSSKSLSKSSSTHENSGKNLSTYNPQAIEPKWQQYWQKEQLFQNSIEQVLAKKEQGKAIDPYYLLFAFAYPSGSGLHVGHVESKTALDILARFYRMQGKDVFFPVGWDAFGLPAENYAIKTGVPPAQTTREAINTFRRQIKRLGISYDWANEIATCHPSYYQWTQWLFKQLYVNDLAYKDVGMVNWCPSCQTVLANEQVVEGLCERCDSPVRQKELDQWYFKITHYKEALIQGLKQVDWPKATKQQQLNWIGRTEGAEIDFTLKETQQQLTCFTTRLDTIFGVTFLVISPEKFKDMALLEQVPAGKKKTVQQYLQRAFQKTEEERSIGEKDKTGVKTGLTVINPVNQEEVPLFVADYVLAHVGTGAVMGVPAHDERDWQFALKHDLEIRPVIKPVDGKIEVDGKEQIYDEVDPQKCTTDYGLMINANAKQAGGRDYSGLTSSEGQQKLMQDFFQQIRAKVNYRLRDWLISRQRYWGTPIPVIYDPAGQPHLIKDKDLPWLLPTDVDFKPTGESPLKSSAEFLQRTQDYAAHEFTALIKNNNWDESGKGWVPEFDTMDTFVDSSWYYLRYLDARNEDCFADKERLDRFMPVDFYLIGPEHIVLHLLYSRFFTKFLRDQGYLDLPSGEPFAKMRHQGMILGPDHKKMSKSKGNVINPDEIVEQYGADTLRVYEMFIGPLEADKPWDDRAVQGVYRFLRKIHDLLTQALSLAQPENNHPQLEQKLHAAIKKVSHDVPMLKFNTAIACLMEFANDWKKIKIEQQQPVKQKELAAEEQTVVVAASLLKDDDLYKLIKLLAPLAPFLAEELWSQIDQEISVHCQAWPSFDEALAQKELIVIPVQVNGKLRGELELKADKVKNISKEQVVQKAQELDSVKKWLVDEKGQTKAVKKAIWVPGKIVNLVV